MANPVETWKAEKHGFEVWPDVERHAAAGTPMNRIDTADLERMKWYGFFYRKRDQPGRYMNRIRITAGELSATGLEDDRLAACHDGGGGGTDWLARPRPTCVATFGSVASGGQNRLALTPLAVGGTAARAPPNRRWPDR